MKNSLRIHKWTHNEFNIFILGVLTRPLCDFFKNQGVLTHPLFSCLSYLILSNHQ